MHRFFPPLRPPRAASLLPLLPGPSPSDAWRCQHYPPPGLVLRESRRQLLRWGPSSPGHQSSSIWPETAQRLSHWPQFSQVLGGGSHQASPGTPKSPARQTRGPKGIRHLLPTFLSWVQIWSGQTRGTCQFDGPRSCVWTLPLAKNGISDPTGNLLLQAASGLKRRGSRPWRVFKDPLLNLPCLERVWEY